MSIFNKSQISNNYNVYNQVKRHIEVQWRAQTSSGAGVERPKRALDIFVVVVVFILSFHDILRKYIELESEQLMHDTSNENRKMMIILLNIIYCTKQNSDYQEGNHVKFIFSFGVGFMYVLWKCLALYIK